MSLSDARQKIIEHNLTASTDPAASKESTTLSAVLETLATFQNPLIPRGGLETLINDICIEDLSFLAQKLDNYLLRPFSSAGGRTPQPSEACSIGDASLRSSQTRRSRNRRTVDSVKRRDIDTCTLSEMKANLFTHLEAAHILPFKLSQESDTVLQFISRYIPMGLTFYQMLDCAENMLMLNLEAHRSFGAFYWYIRCGDRDENGQRVYTSHEAKEGSGVLECMTHGKRKVFTDESGMLVAITSSNGKKMLIGPVIEGGASQPDEKYCVIHELICRMLDLRGGAEPEWLEEDDYEEYDDNVKDPPFLMPERVDIDAKVRKYLESMDLK